jgi:hypothetical protein
VPNHALGALPAPPLTGLLALLDALRARLLLWLAPHARSLFVVRDRRVALFGSALLIVAFLGASVAPLWIVALGPILWGVPHVVSDLRYLIARPGYGRRPSILLCIGGGILAASLGAGVRGALGAAIVAILVARGTARRRALGVLFVSALFAAAQWAGRLSDLAFVHLHNAVGVALFWAWRPRTTRLHWLPLALFAAFVTLLFAGAAEPILARTHGLSAPFTGLSVRGLAESLSPTTEGAWTARFLVVYAFAQSAHYIVWLRLIPEEDRPSPTPRSFAQSYRALRADIGALILWIALGSAVALAIWAAKDLGAARNGYIYIASFHGYLEIIAAAALFAEAGRRKAREGHA